MVYPADQCARNAELDRTNAVGMCLQQTRTWCGIGPRWPDASTAWRENEHKHRNRQPPRGAPVYWLGGSRGHGHIALSLGRGMVRSTDAGGSGVIATRPLEWFENNWGLPYVGWSPSINGVVIPGFEEDDDEMKPEDWVRMREIVADEVAKNNDNVTDLVKDAVWNKMLEVTKPSGDKDDKSAKQVLRETWQRVAKL